MNTEELSNRLTQIVQGYETQFIEFGIWGQNDDPIPGIKLFKDLNIYLEREYCEY